MFVRVLLLPLFLLDSFAVAMAHYKEAGNFLILGQTGQGMSFYHTRELIHTILKQNIVNKHLNNNNWLRIHGKPSIRKGHPLYNECKKYKGLKPFNIEIMNEGTEFETINLKIKEKNNENGKR